MKLGTYIKQPSERESFSITYEDDLTEGDNVDTAVVKSIVPTGELIIDQIAVVDPRVRFWATGGTADSNYKVTFTVTTADGRILEDEVTIKVKEY